MDDEEDGKDSELEITDVDDENDQTFIEDIQNLNELSQLKEDLVKENEQHVGSASSSGLDQGSGSNLPTSGNSNKNSNGQKTVNPLQSLSLNNNLGNIPGSPSTQQQHGQLQQALLALKNNPNSANLAVQQQVAAVLSQQQASQNIPNNLPSAAVAAALTSQLNLKNQINANLLNQVTLRGLGMGNIPGLGLPSSTLGLKRKFEAGDDDDEEDSEDEETNKKKKKKPHVKKPLNAFMLFMKEQRQKVVNECTLKESAAINQILGRKWHNLSKEEQQKYYDKKTGIRFNARKIPM